MKKNLTKNKEEKNHFFEYFAPYMNLLGKANFVQESIIDLDRRFFGWELYMNLKQSQLTANIVKPKFKLDPLYENYICFSENQGLLKIIFKSKSYERTFTVECHQRLAESRLIRSYFIQLNSVFEKSDKCSRLNAIGTLHLIVALFTELIFEAPHLDSYMRDTKRQMMIKVNSCIKSKIGTAFTAQDVVEELGYSIQYLNKVSQDFRALSLNNFINFSKLERFRSKLIKSSQKVAALAEECGFPDVNYLIQLFKKTYFHTPHQLRKKMLSGSSDERKALNAVAGFEVLDEIKKPSSIQELSVKDKRCTLILVNLSKEPLELYWISPEYEEVPMNLLEGLERFHLGSADGHVWMLKKAGKTAYFRVGKKNCLIMF